MKRAVTWRFLMLAASVCYMLGRPSAPVHTQTVPDPWRTSGATAWRDQDATKLAATRDGNSGQRATCVDGFAAGYPCHRVDLRAQVTPEELGATSGSDAWGWRDPVTGSEVAIMTHSHGTSFVNIDDPDNPQHLGVLPGHDEIESTWRDVKVYKGIAYIVSEATGHGMQLFDLEQLRLLVTYPVTFPENRHFSGFGEAHNIAINEESGFAYVLGSDRCQGGLYMIDLQVPDRPAFAGCYSDDGFTHDAQCVHYSGLDPDYSTREICFAFNEDTITIVDVTDKNTPTLIAREGRPGCEAPDNCYIHQGWLTEDQNFLLVNDELDEFSGAAGTTRTYVYDVRDLDNPMLLSQYNASVASIDHNHYVQGDHLYAANYTSGLRILDLQRIEQGIIREVAYFDTYPENDSAIFRGAWTAFPYFESGAVIVSDFTRGLFVVTPRLQQISLPILWLAR